MNFHIFSLFKVVIFNFLLLTVRTENKNYIISIRRNENDKEYDMESDQIQNQIDILVNDRMNDIYDIIVDNKESFITKDGKLDEKLNELPISSQLRKRGENNTIKNKFYFINKIRPKDFYNYHSNKKIIKTKSISKNKMKLNSSLKEDVIEQYIPFESNLITHICPVSNRYLISAYLSDSIVEKVRQLPNVVSCYEDIKTYDIHAIDEDDNYISNNNSNNNKDNNNNNNNSTDDKYYNIEDILKETQWKSLNVQEDIANADLRNTHLSLLSQGKYYGNSTFKYDNNYYYPSSAGKGIDIYIIDTGLDKSFSEENFDTYQGTPDERIIKCEKEIYNLQYHNTKDDYCYNRTDKNNIHGTIVSISAAGKLNGAAKKANLRILATENTIANTFVALDYVKRHAQPHKSIVNLSRGASIVSSYTTYDSYDIYEKIGELKNLGVIVFVSAGNNDQDTCNTNTYARAYGVIVVGGVDNKLIDHSNQFEDMYQRIHRYYKDHWYGSHYGNCVDLFAPYSVRVTDSTYKNIIYQENGTSFSSPLVAGIAATIMSENPNIEFDYDSMKKKLIDLSLKDVLKNIPEGTPNRLANNGKWSVYGPKKPINTEIGRCGPDFNDEVCPDNQCCSSQGYCGKTAIHCGTGCKLGYGQCITTDRKCGPSNNFKRCPNDQCCSSQGYCGTTNPYCGTGCQSEFGQCYNPALNKPDKRCGPNYQYMNCPDDQCCSFKGYCGYTYDHCRSKDCELGFGICHTSNNKCGPNNNNTKCQNDECCSADGQCGSTDYHCGNGCQSKFGRCFNTN